MEYRNFQFDFRELGITKELLAKVMGYEDGRAPEPFDGLIDEVLSKAPEYCDIHGGYTIRRIINLDKTTRTLQIDGIGFMVHKIIAGQLKHAEMAALFICTAGAGIGEWSRKLMKSGDMIKGYVADVAGSETVESAMDIIQSRLEKEMEENSMHITERYSPGYCDWQVGEQQKLFSFFPDNYCGIRLSPTSLMYPIKSISGVIGIGKKVKRNGYICNLCEMKDCIYRNKRHAE